MFLWNSTPNVYCVMNHKFHIAMVTNASAVFDFHSGCIVWAGFMEVLVHK